MPRTQLAPTKAQEENETNQVSCSILKVSHTKEQTLNDIATSINVQLKFENWEIPFVPYKEYEDVKSQDKSFIYGRSGCGKSRVIYEIIKERLPSFNRVIIINPRPLVGLESHRMGLSKLTRELSSDDAVLWNNFPDELLIRDLESVKDVLRLISSKAVGCLLIALKPKYFEIFNNISDISEFYVSNIYYERETIQSVIKEYGTCIPRLRSAYRKHIAKDLNQIAAILWQKEPLPITVLDYFKELVQKTEADTGLNLNGIKEAQSLFVTSKYYQHKFNLISNLDSRKNDVEFLYTLKLSYDAGLNREIHSIGVLQRGIFGSSHDVEHMRRMTT